MARTLKRFDFPERHAANSRYPWDQWLDGQIWQITRGEDFDISTESMRVRLYPAAKARGGSIRTNVKGSTITFQFTKNRKRPTK
jgi:hypothetical protein